ncbi:MAG: hypothetical protein OK439_02895 [Thaumarchaeota archaeon]|nr:hypothetical protein [Nitrososphaerota archaeon]
MSFLVNKDVLSVFVWSVILSGVFLVARPAIGFAAIVCCMFFTFYLFSDFSDAKATIRGSTERVN